MSVSRVFITLLALSLFMLGLFGFITLEPALSLWGYAKNQPRICTQLLEGNAVFSFCEKDTSDASAQNQ